MGKKGKKSNKNKSTQSEPEPESEVETKIEESIHDDKIEVEQKAINTDDNEKLAEVEQKNDNEQEQKVENSDNTEKEKGQVEKEEKEEVSNDTVIEPKLEEKEANSDNITEGIKEEKASVQEQEKNDKNTAIEPVSEEKEISVDNATHEVKEEEKGGSQEQESKIEVDELKERQQEHLEASTPVPNPQDLSLLISDLAMADPFSLPIENNQSIEENRADSAEEFNNTSSISKEIDLSSLPVTPTDFNFDESDIERSNVSNNENEETGLEDPFSPQVESPPFEYKEEQVVDNIDESQGDLTAPSSIKQEAEAELEPIQLDEPKIEPKEQDEYKLADTQEELKMLDLDKREYIPTEISLSSPELVKEIDKLPNLVDNSLFFDIPLNDPLHELTQFHLGAHVPKSNRYSATDLANDMDQSWQATAQQLGNSNRWRSLVGFTRHKLTNTPKQDIDSIMKLWEFRLKALANISLYQLASAELEKWGSILGHEYRYESYPNLFPQRAGYMIPFSILILWARLPSCLGNITKSIDRLYSLLIHHQRQSKANKNEEECLLIIQLIVSLLIQVKDYSQATRLLDKILLKLDSNVYLLSNLGRLHLLGGNIEGAAQVFEKLEQLTKTSDDPEIILLNQLNKGLLFMGQGNWDEANDLLLELYQNNLNDITVLNALAVSKVYRGQHVEAIQMLQSHLTQPGRPSEVGVLNLCTLYELHTDLHTHKKVELLEQVHSNLGDGFPLKNFKLN